MPKIKGSFSQVIYSPQGGVEGFLIDNDGIAVQFVIAADDERHAALVMALVSGQILELVGEDAPASRKGDAAHRVMNFGKLTSVDGNKPAKPSSAVPGYAGRIVRLNYAKHGAPNGYVLDSGDFVHVKPDGFAKLGLSIGDAVTVEGDAHFLATGGGWAVEAEVVNGRKVK